MQQYAASKVEAAKYGDIGTLMIEYWNYSDNDSVCDYSVIPLLKP
jgi:hypothetical protein